MLPDLLFPFFRACKDAGGRALLVGGSVRDALLGKDGKDLDIEVHSLEIPALIRVLRRFGPVNEVGRSFGVLKMRLHGYDLDVSVPRQDVRQGPGHRGIQATAAPYIGVVEAARRRDLTINAIGYDPLNGEYVDPFQGQADLKARLLRAVDAQTFAEDPLRALRAAQFAGRFAFEIHPELERLCQEMPLHELPAERIQGEVDKLLLKAGQPSIGWDLARRTGMWAKVLPAWDQCPEALDRLAQQSWSLDPSRRRALLYAVACGFCTLEQTISVLDSLRLHRWEGYRLREQVCFLVEYRSQQDFSDADIRRMADAGDVELLAILREEPVLAQRAEGLGVLHAPLPPLLLGRDLAKMGMTPGPKMGQLLHELRQLQLDGQMSQFEEAWAWAQARLAS